MATTGADRRLGEQEDEDERDKRNVAWQLEGERMEEDDEETAVIAAGNRNREAERKEVGGRKGGNQSVNSVHRNSEDKWTTGRLQSPLGRVRDNMSHVQVYRWSYNQAKGNEKTLGEEISYVAVPFPL